jgi:hypothetical protein
MVQVCINHIKEDYKMFPLFYNLQNVFMILYMERVTARTHLFGCRENKSDMFE